MKLTSMKLEKVDVIRASEPMMTDKDAPRYPYGLQVTLDDEALKRLGIKALPDVDATMVLNARVTVTRASSSATIGGKKHRSVELQITEMALGADAGEGDAADTLYGGKK